MTVVGQGRRRYQRLVRRVALALGLLAFGLTGCSGGSKPGVLAAGERMPTGITVTSTAFGQGEAIPERFSCEGENVPPPLAWKGIPAGTKELVLVIEDPEAPSGIFVHWIVAGVDPKLPQLTGTEPPTGATVLPGSSDNPTYIGPCPPDGQKHRYFFEVYALPESPSLAGRSSPLERVRAIRKAASAGGVLIATFAR